LSGILGLLGVLAGCGKPPYPREPLAMLQDPKPLELRQSFAGSMPYVFTTDDTLVVQAPFHDDIAILDVLRVDRPAGTFEMVGLNQLGVKLFDLKGDRRGAAVIFAIPPLMEHQNLLLAFAKDIRRMYFDLVPDNGAKTRIKPDRVKFTEKSPDADVAYEFAAQPPRLLEKYDDGFFGSAWRVGYYKYEPTTTGLYPRGIVMENSQYHYRIIIKNRDLEIEE
jgi:hypothetical protein